MAESEIYSRLSVSDIKNEVEKDTYYSWIICACGFISRVLIVGVLHGFGSFFVAFVHEFNTTKESSAWVGSLAYGLSMTFGPFSSMLVNRFGNRIVMVTGGLMCSVALLAASFVHSIEMLFVTFSVFYGIGTCMCITPIMTIAVQYFDKYLTVAVGIITAGSSFGTLIYAPMSQALIDSFGWRNTFRCYAGLCSISAICSLFIKPLTNQKKSSEQKLKQSPIRNLIQDFKLWKNRVFVVWTIAITLVMFGFYIPYVHLVAYAVDCGIPLEKGAIFVMMLGACTACGRIVFGKIIQFGYLNRLHMHQFSMVITGTGVMLLPLLKTFAGISAYVICVGLVDGCYVVLLPVLTSTLVGVENTVLAWGFLVGTSSITFTAGPPLAGALYDMMGSYDLSFHLAGLPIIAGALILFLIPWAQRTSKTNNVMIAVSEYNVEDECDSADDTRNGEPRNQDTKSTTTLTSPIPEYYRNKARNQTRFTTKRYKDQGTSTSPTSIHVPIDIHEALAMFHENAQMVAKLLEKSAGQLNPQTNTKNSTLSRSEMIQASSAGTGGLFPQNVISIMSVPGGVAIGTFGSNIQQTAPSESISSNVVVHGRHGNQQTQSLASDAISLHSSTSDDPTKVATDAFSPTPSKIYHLHQLISPVCMTSMQSAQEAAGVNETIKSPFEQTISDHFSKLKNSLSGPSQVTDTTKPQETKSGEQHLNIECSHPKNNTTSPCYISSPSKLSSIPEVPHSKNDTSTETQSESRSLYTWTKTSSNDQQNIEKAVTPQSSSSTSDGDTNTEQDMSKVQSELDVFTHLFSDDNV